jgi:hypothetical protein
MKGKTEPSDETAYISTRVPKTGEQNSPQEDAKIKGNQPIRMKKGSSMTCNRKWRNIDVARRRR